MEMNKLTIYQALEHSALEHSNDVALYYFHNKISFKKLLELIEETASILQNVYRISKGDAVLLSLPNIPQTIILFYALNKIGAVSNMVHPNSPFEVMQKYYQDADCKMAFLFNQRVYRQLKEYQNFKGTVVLCSAGTFLDKRNKTIYGLMNHAMIKEIKATKSFQFFSNLQNTDIPSKENPIDSSDTSVLLHSASTTGNEKTICVSGRSFNFTSSRAEEILCFKKDEFSGKSFISVLPSFHGFGLCMTMHVPLTNGFGVVLIPKFSAKNVVKAMNFAKNVTCICGVPNVFKTLINDLDFVNSKYLRTLSNCYCGGDSLSMSLKEQFDSVMIRAKSKCRLYEGYGLTEALSVCTVNTHRHHKKGSIGYPITGVEIAIFDDKNKALGPNEIGEIAIKSENNMLGYFNDPKATESTYHDGYLKTGDLGYLDEDNFLYFTARKKRVIKVSGVAIFPHEIEKVISSLSGVKSVCVIQIPDENTINAAKAYVVSRNRDASRIIEECKKRLISWSIPKEVEFVSSLPMTKMNKVDFKKVQELENSKRKV